MKKFFIKFAIIMLSLVLSFLMLPQNQTTLKAEDQSQNSPVYTLIGSDFNSNSDASLKYNIESSKISSFTPFDLEKGERMEGDSFSFNQAERNQIINQYIKVNDIEINEKLDYSLFIWIYFDSTYLHNLTITLEFDNGATLKWQFDDESLIQLIKKTTTVNLVSMPFSWNQLELPFCLADQVGEVFDGQQLNKVSKIFIDFTSEEIESENGDIEQEMNIIYASLKFYNIYISKSTKTTEYSVIKQNYQFYKFKFSTNQVDKYSYVGDNVLLPTFSNAIEYAWKGVVNLADSQAQSIVWKVFVRTSSSGEVEHKSFGDNIIFEKEGVYEIFYQCFDLNVSNEQPIISDSLQINVSKLRPIYLDKSKYNLEYGKQYILNVYTSEAVEVVSNFEFIPSDVDAMDILYQDGKLYITANKIGKYTIDVNFSGYRKNNGRVVQYEESFEINIRNTKPKDMTSLKIMLYILLIIFGVLLIIYIIKKVVDARKFGVK